MSRLNNNDPLSLLLATDNSGNFMSSSGNKNKAIVVKGLNSLYVSGDKDFIARYIADWFITISNKVINSNIADTTKGYEITHVVSPKNIQLISNDTRYNIGKLKKFLINLFLFNESIKVIKLIGGEYVIEDETGKTMLNDSIKSECCINTKI